MLNDLFLHTTHAFKNHSISSLPGYRNALVFVGAARSREDDM